MLGDALELDRTTTAAFERGIRARNMTLYNPDHNRWNSAEG
jgi:hypothetical protein